MHRFASVCLLIYSSKSTNFVDQIVDCHIFTGPVQGRLSLLSLSTLGDKFPLGTYSASPDPLAGFSKFNSRRGWREGQGEGKG